MKVYKTNEIKNIALVGGKGAGKTTLTESILLEGGTISRRGSVDGGNTVSDNTPVEKEYGYSVSSCVFYAEKNGKKLNFFDCPGSDDFVGNTVTALSVTDTAALVVDGRNGVEVGTMNNFRTVDRIGKPLMFVINRLEDEKCDFDNVYNQLRETYGNKVVALQFPVNAGPGFNSVVDVLSMKQYTWPKDGGKATAADIDGANADKAEEYRMALLEMAAENDEELMMKFLDEMTLTDEETIKGIRLGMVDRSIFPVVLVSAENNIGTDRMLDIMTEIVPEVTEMPAPKNANGDEVPYDENGPVSIFFFKTSVESHIGLLQGNERYPQGWCRPDQHEPRQQGAPCPDQRGLWSEQDPDRRAARW